MQTAFVVKENVTEFPGRGFVKCFDVSTSKYQCNVSDNKM